jgi:hypothetical protein
MMRRFVKSVLAGLAGLAALTALSTGAEAQEIQLTGPLAGAPAVRKLRLHRAGRFEIAPGVSFSLLDQYRRTLLPGAALTYHVTDWLGFGVWGGFGIAYNAGLADELQTKAIDGRDCADKPFSKACKLTATNLTRGKIEDTQLGKMQWIVSPQIQVVPFRGKLALFSSLFVDTDVNIFAGPAFIGLQERADCGADSDGVKLAVTCSEQASFTLASRVAVTGTFGLGLNFYPSSFVGFGFEFRALPFKWNTSGFDNHGGGANGDFPDLNVNSADRELHFNSMITVHASFQFPTAIKTTD